ncbi:MAG TPA: complex I subunit 5 family protein [Acidimicrobiales bacterium]|nr:complex I subunit 5 family protein [Acidimicrobiales bacterium]
MPLSTVVPLSVAVPLAVAALLAAAGNALPSLVRDVVAIATAAATAALCGLLLAGSGSSRPVYWFGGWLPQHGRAIGIDYTVDALGAGFALLSAVLATIALIYSRSYFDRMGGRYPALVLVFVAGMTDFSLSGDLFNMFVGFELVAITAVVLTGFYADAEAPLQGAINFAVTASIGTLLFLVGIALLYDRTQTLNLADMGAALAGHRLGGAVVVAFAALLAAFLTKAAIAPFHFWLPDAYGTAPVPACVLFAGVMSEMGIFGVARVWTTVFAGAHLPGGSGGLTVGLCVLGSVTGLVGAVMAGRQRRLRRMLGFVTLAHTGLYLLGIGLLTSTAAAAVAILVVGDGLVKAGMFLAAGVAHRHTGPVDPWHGAGRDGRGPPVPALTAGGAASLAVLAVGALALADLPPFASADGKDLLVAAAGSWGPAVEVVYALTVIGSSGAVLAAVARRFRAGRAVALAAAGRAVAPAAAGRPDDDPPSDREETPSEEEGRAQSAPAGAGRLLAPAGALLAGALAVGLLPHLDPAVARAAARFFDRPAYDAVVAGRPLPALRVPALPAVPAGATAVDVAEALSAVVVGAVLASRHRAARAVRAAGAAATGWLRRLHSGHVGDQVTWQTVGTVAVAALAALALR